jgi:IS1 family transposase
MANVLPHDTRVKIASALCEGLSIRATARLLDVDRETVMYFGVLAGEACAALHDGLVRDVRPTLLQCDEAWSYVGKKEMRCTDLDPEDFGDQYLFIGMDALSKLVVSYLVDKRTAEATHAFAKDLRARVLGAPQISTDGFKPYVDAIDSAFGSECSHGVVMKQYASQGSAEQAALRYSPSRVIGIERIAISGTPDEPSISTTYVERQNLTLRMSIKRMARLTNAFSKKLRNLKAAISLHMAFYNFCRVHETLRVTPAMQSGLTDHVWSVDELLRVALGEKSPPPRPPHAPLAPSAKRSTPIPDDGPIPIGRATRVPFLRVVKGGAS